MEINYLMGVSVSMLAIILQMGLCVFICSLPTVLRAKPCWQSLPEVT